jgi:predicted enzyme related to lactoylglutathione lyase
MPKYEFQPGTFCWVELATSDRRAAVDFYRALFGWTTRELPMGAGPDDIYVMLLHNGVEAAAAMTKQDPGPPRWNSYVGVTSADEAAEKVKSLGGTVVAGPFDVMQVGRMAASADPQGAALALWQPKPPGNPFVRDEPNTLCWNELWTTDLEGARAYYAPLFGWTMKISPEYTEVHLGEKGIGGMMTVPMPDMPPAWLPYFMVTDVEATTAKAKSLGATIYVESKDIPNVGRFAVIADPQGAVFNVFKPAAG